MDEFNSLEYDPEEIDALAAQFAEDSQRFRPQRKHLALLSLIFGLFNLCAWIAPVCSLPMIAVSLVCGYFGYQTSDKNLAIIGMSLSGVSLVLSLIHLALLFFAPEPFRFLN